LSAHLLSFFRGYQSSFYHPEECQSDDILDDGSRLFLNIFWDFPTDTFWHPGTIKWMTHKESILPSRDNQVDDAQRTCSTIQGQSSGWCTKNPFYCPKTIEPDSMRGVMVAVGVWLEQN